MLEAAQRATRLTPNKARALLGRFLFSGEEAEKPLAGLSGGERRRLSLAILVHSGANVLILDEPTNHLDLESREALEDALRAFQGSVLLVSHDRALLDAVGTRTVAVEDGALHSYVGGWAEYVRAREARREAQVAAKRPRERPRSAPGRRRRRTAPSKNARAGAPQLEREIERGRGGARALEDELADPAAWAEPQRTADSTARHDAGRRAIDELYAEWGAHGMSELHLARSVTLTRDEEVVDRVEPWGGGVALISPSQPRLWDSNYLRVDRPDGLTAADLAAQAERMLGAAGAFHRAVVVPDGEAGEALRPQFSAQGWDCDRLLFMVLRGTPRRRPRAPAAQEVDLAALERLKRDLATGEPDGEAEIAEEVMLRQERSARHSRIRHFGVRAGDRLAASCSLVLREGVAEVDDVATLRSHRGRGLARSAVIAAVEAARREGPSSCSSAPTATTGRTAGIAGWASSRWACSPGFAVSVASADNSQFTSAQRLGNIGFAGAS